MYESEQDRMYFNFIKYYAVMRQLLYTYSIYIVQNQPIRST